MWTIAMLIRTYGGRSWNGPMTWDGVYGPTVNGHTYSAVGPATNTDDPYDGKTPAGSDGRSIAVYVPIEWLGVVLTNDGHAWMHGTRIEVGGMWRGGDELIDSAAQIGRRAQLPTEPRTTPNGG